MQEEQSIGTGEASEILNISRSRIARLIREGRLPAQKVGSTWVIKPSDLELVRERKPGFPKGRKKT
jgi:excisionase family DNA binding protein